MNTQSHALITHNILVPNASNVKSHVHVHLFLFLLLFSVMWLRILPRLPHDQTSESDSRNDSNDARARHRSGSARFSAAARAVVSDVVPLGGDFEDGAWARVAAVVVVDEEEVGRGAVVA